MTTEVEQDLQFFLDIVKCESRGKSPKEMLYLHKKVFELGLYSSEEDYPRHFDVSEELNEVVLDALTLADMIIRENNPGLRNPDTKMTFGEIIGLIEPTEFDPNFDEDLDARSGNKRTWIFSYLWDMKNALDGWLEGISS